MFQLKDSVTTKLQFPVKKMLHQKFQSAFGDTTAKLPGTYSKVEELLLCGAIPHSRLTCPATSLSSHQNKHPNPHNELLSPSIHMKFETWHVRSEMFCFLV